MGLLENVNGMTAILYVRSFARLGLSLLLSIKMADAVISDE